MATENISCDKNKIKTNLIVQGKKRSNLIEKIKHFV
jgi:hypothetical protein